MSELEEKIKKELLKSGFPLQVFCQRCLLEHKWGVSAGPEHMVFPEEVKKETDVTGYFQQGLGKNTTIFYTLYVECKKNHDNPWVFFKGLPGCHILIEYENIDLNKSPFEAIDAIEDLHFHKTPLSSIYTMAFRPQRNQIYEAIIKLVSSYKFFIEFRTRHRIESGDKSKSICVCFLTILFDGRLYLADIKDNDNLELEERNHVIYYYCEVKYPEHRHFNIEVVTKDYFLNYLDVLNKDRILISKYFRRQLRNKGV